MNVNDFYISEIEKTATLEKFMAADDMFLRLKNKALKQTLTKDLLTERLVRFKQKACRKCHQNIRAARPLSNFFVCVF